MQRAVAGVARRAAVFQVGLHDRVLLLPSGRHLRLAGPEICSESPLCRESGKTRKRDVLECTSPPGPAHGPLCSPRLAECRAQLGPAFCVWAAAAARGPVPAPLPSGGQANILQVSQ